MYDKVKLFLPHYSKQDKPNLKEITDVEERTNKNGTSIHGKLGIMKIKVFQDRTIIEGSFSKFLYNSNIYTLDKNSTKEVIEKLSYKLNVDIGKAKVSYIEFGTNHLMKKPVLFYLSKFGNYPRLQKYIFGNSSICYRTSQKSSSMFMIRFYDKLLEMENKKISYPNSLKGCHLLRYEIALKGYSIAKGIYAESLYNDKTYNNFIGLYRDTYFKIEKMESINNELTQIKTIQDAMYLYLARKIDESTINKPQDFIEELKANKIFKDRNNYYRLKKLFQKILKGNTTDDKPIKELDDSIINATTNY